MWLASHAVFLALERFKELGFVRLGNTYQACGLLRIGQRAPAGDAPWLPVYAVDDRVVWSGQPR